MCFSYGTIPRVLRQIQARENDRVGAWLRLSLLTVAIPVMNQIDTGHDVDHLILLGCQHARVAGQQKSIGFVQMRLDVERRQRAGHDFIDGNLVQIAVVVQNVRPESLPGYFPPACRPW